LHKLSTFAHTFCVSVAAKLQHYCQRQFRFWWTKIKVAVICKKEERRKTLMELTVGIISVNFLISLFLLQKYLPPSS
jgi:hypothetical protein